MSTPQKHGKPCEHTTEDTPLFAAAGDSQLVRVHATPPNPAEPEVLVEVLDNFDNLGPIVDFVVVDLDRQGQGQVRPEQAACSG